MTTSKDVRIADGIVRGPYNFRVYWRADGRQHAKRFPLNTPLAVLRAFRAQMKQSPRATAPRRATPHDALVARLVAALVPLVPIIVREILAALPPPRDGSTS